MAWGNVVADRALGVGIHPQQADWLPCAWCAADVFRDQRPAAVPSLHRQLQPGVPGRDSLRPLRETA